jgi:FixJ family two-component response regulator
VTPPESRVSLGSQCGSRLLPLAEGPISRQQVTRYRYVMAEKLLVAVVDDDASVRKAIRRLLIASNLQVETFASGEEFLRSLCAHTPDCLILDLHMPGLTGLDVQRQITRIGLRLPIVVVTAYDEAESQAQCLAAGAAAYLHKPLDDRVLLDAVTAAVLRS